MIKYDFWDDWTNVTSIENKAIVSVKKARRAIINSVPKKELVAIYIKGSFARREMNAKSDVDIVPIVTKNIFEGKIFGVNSKNLAPTVIVPLSIQEFESNTLCTQSDNKPDLRAEPDLFLRELENYRIIYGAPLDINKFPMRNDEEVLLSEKNKILKGYIPAYKKKKIDFKTVLKEFFWFTHAEQKALGNYPEHSFEGIAQSVKDKQHPIHQALTLRKNKTDGNEESMFIELIEDYLKSHNS